MGMLGKRGARPLLTRVNGQPHASKDDHIDEDYGGRRKSTRTKAEKSIPTPPSTERLIPTRGSIRQEVDLTNDEEDVDCEPEDYDADPISDDSFSDVESTMKDGRASKEEVMSIDRSRSNGIAKDTVQGAQSKLSSSQGSAASMRKRSFDVEEDDSAIFFDVRHPAKKQRPGRTTAEPLVNMHVPERKPPYRPKTYGRSSQQSNGSSQGFKDAKNVPTPKKSPKKAFKNTEGVVAKVDVEPAFRTRTFEVDSSKASSQDIQAELDRLRQDALTAEQVNNTSTSKTDPQKGTTHCTFCGEVVDMFLKEDFEDQYNKGKELSFKWERRFCTYHRRNRASESWKENRYPDIDWTFLERRMQHHNGYLLYVLHGEIESHHRKALKDKLQPGRRAVQQAYKSDENARPGALVGYYGPRGEKMMSEHIISSMSWEIRAQAVKDRLVASTGVQGGVAGFVQSVLVPHLAEQLVCEDLKMDGKNSLLDARRIIASSAELGELMHPEAADQIVQEINDEDD